MATFIVINRRWLASIASLTTVFSFFRHRSDGSLIRGIQERDKDAFDELMKRYSKPLRGFAVRRLPYSDVEDVLQETWLTVWEKAGSLDDGARFKPWLFTICFHKIQDFWRRSGNAPVSTELVAGEGLAMYTPKGFSQIELSQCFGDFWAECSADQREMLGMYYGDGLTLKEIGEVLGRNLNTVKYQFYRIHEMAASKMPDSETMLREVGQ